MNADRRVVPSHHVTSVLAEESLSERTLEVKQTLKHSPNKVHNVAHKWLLHDGINPLARVMIQNVERVPRTISIKKIHTEIHHEKETNHHDNNHINKTHGHEAHGGHGHDAHGHGHEAHGGHGHDAHGHGHEAHGGHGHDAHGHGHEAHGGHGHDAHGHGHEAHGGHGHDAHGHGHEAHGGHGHDAHGHGHEAHGGHGHTGGLASFVSTGHWFGDHGAFIFGMIGRGLGEFIGYTLKLLAVLMIFGPTRTAIITMIVIIVLNIYLGTSLSVWLGAGALLIIHGIFSIIAHLGRGGGHEGHGGGGGHGHDDHGHGGGHGHDHGHGHH